MMSKLKAQLMVQNARMHLVERRRNDPDRDLAFGGTPEFRQAWNILFAAENLISDPRNAHYERMLERRGVVVAREVASAQ